MNLADLIESSRDHLSHFDYDHYPSCFQSFEASCAPLFDAMETADGKRCAAELIEELERRRAALPRREQKDAAREEKQVLALFLSPAATRRGGHAASFAEALNRAWNARYPRNSFLLGSYETILKGFDANLLGLPLRKSKNRN